MRVKFLVGIGVFVTFAILISVHVSYASNPLKSSHYEFDESALGGTGFIDSQSANYKASGASGLLGGGNSAGTNFQTNAGHVTTNDPALAFAVNATSVNFGSFSASAATVSTSTFQVLDYTSYGYNVQIIGSPPTNGSHAITAMTTTGPSQAGTEQFGINLVANTSPVSVGANPDHGQFGIGSASTNYGTSNQYRFVSGETIATAPKSSGVTTYTISYLVNVSSLTPGGQYNSSQTIICTGSY
jgi:hypothetical protein